jgi:hypothetical protein
MRHFAFAFIHWAARGAALLVVGTFLLFLAGNLINPYSGPPTEFREWAGLALLFAVVIGMLAAWKWELSGALLSLLALAAFVPVVRMHRYDVVAFAAIPAILYLCDWWLRHKVPAAIPR